MLTLDSSLRAVLPEETLRRAKMAAASLGITRVTDITRLDSIGIPVCTSVRPDAVKGSLCVNAGKGVRAIDARVGAYMEAIEFAMAEPRHAKIPIEMRTARDLLDGATRPEAIFELCPVLGQEITLDMPVACSEAADLISGNPVLVPSELVLLPYVGKPGTGLFGSSSNGLASGNTRAEAILHGLLEVVERDVRSLQTVEDHSTFVTLDSLPAQAREMIGRIEDAGLSVAIRTQPTIIGLPFFGVAIYDPFVRTPFYLSGGFGCHLVREIALHRAIAEAVQSRLSCIHGARDDLEDRHDMLAQHTGEELAQAAANEFARLSSADRAVSYDAIEDRSCEASSIEGALDYCLDRLTEVGVRHVCQVRLPAGMDGLEIVRVIVPRLEYFTRTCHRMGPRLYAFVRRQHG